MIWGFISSTIMFNSFFLFILLLVFKHTHLIPDYDVFFCNILHFLSFCPLIVFFNNNPRPISLNTHPTLPKPLATAPDSPSVKTAGHLSNTFLLSPQSCPTNFRIPLPLPYTSASPSRRLPSSSNFCILGSWFQTLLKSMIR